MALAHMVLPSSYMLSEKEMQLSIISGLLVNNN